MLTDWLSDLRYRLRMLFHRADAEADLAAELQDHLERETEHLVRQGVDPDEARRLARLAFGGLEEAKEQSRDARGTRLFEELARDFAGGLRSIRRQPGLAFAVAASLGLGSGVATAVFNLTHNVLLARLPVPHPEQLIALHRVTHDSRDDAFSWNELTALRAVAGAELAAVRTASQVAVAAGEQREYINIHFVDGWYFPLAGITPAAGRLLTPQDDEQPAAVAVLAESFARRLFPADSTAVGRTVTIRGVPFTVVGVTPATFRGLEFPGYFTAAIPLSATPLLGREGIARDNRHLPLGAVDDRLTGARAFRIFGRVPEHRQSVTAGLELAYQQCCTIDPGYAETRLDLLDIRRGLVGRKDDFRSIVGAILLILLAGTGLVMVVVCCNLASLLLIRATARQREMAVRISLGAGRGRLVRQQIMEIVPLTLAGGLLGLVVAGWTTTGFVRGIPEWDQYSDLLRFKPGPVVLLFTALLTLVSGTAVALYPALRTSRSAPGLLLRLDGRASTGRSASSLARGVVIVQFAVSVVLVTAATLFGASVHNLERVDGGFTTDRVLLASLEARGTPYEAVGLMPLQAEILRQSVAAPGISDGAVTTMVPLFGGNTGWLEIETPGTITSTRDRPLARLAGVSPGYFGTLGIPLKAGRDFTEADRPGSEPVIVVSESLVRRYFGERDPIDQTLGISPGDGKAVPARIVGIAADVRYDNLRSIPDALVYQPLTQTTEPWSVLLLVMRTRSDPMAALPALLEAIERAAPGLRTTRLSEMESQRETALAIERLVAQLAAFVSAVALAVAALGLYGLVGYGVARRTNELGIRRALGAGTSGIIWLVLRDTLRFLGLGLVVGLPLSLAANTLIRSQFFGVGAHDPLLTAGSILILAGVALLASVIPARQAVRIDPRVALNAE